MKKGIFDDIIKEWIRLINDVKVYKKLFGMEVS